MAAPNTYLNPRASSHLQTRSSTPTSSMRGSLTQLVDETADSGSRSRSPSSEPLVLRLRGAHERRTATSASLHDDTIQPPNRRRRHIQWDENVIDNEGLGRKKSKVCCIYHKPRAVGESSDESSSSSSSDNDSSSSDDGSNLSASSRRRRQHADGARPANTGHRRNTARRSQKKQHSHSHGHHEGDECHDHESPRPKRRPSPNAYERMPKYDVKPLTQQP